jgi:hypothetical protein
MTDDQLTIEWRCGKRLTSIKKDYSFIIKAEPNLRHYSIVNDLNLSSRYLINVSQIPEDALKQRRLQVV